MSQKRTFVNTTRKARWRPDRPWNDLPKLPPTVDVETRVILKQCVTSRAALAELWLIYILKGIEETAIWTTAKIGAVRKLSVDTTEYVRRKLPKIYSRELVDVIFEQPYCRIANLVESGIAGRQAASRYLKALVDAGILEERQFGKEKLFVHPKLMTLLTRDSSTVKLYV